MSLSEVYQFHFQEERKCGCNGNGVIERDGRHYICPAHSWLTARARTMQVLAPYALPIPKALPTIESNLKGVFTTAIKEGRYNLEANPIKADPLIITIRGGADVAAWVANGLYCNSSKQNGVHQREHVVFYTTSSRLLTARMERHADAIVDALICESPVLVVLFTSDARSGMDQIRAPIWSRQYGLAVMVEP